VLTRLKRAAPPYALLLPSVVVLLAFLAAPFVSLFYFALRETSLAGSSSFVGLDNFYFLQEDHLRSAASGAEKVRGSSNLRRDRRAGHAGRDG
jgi:ABC-type sugar transport system permease subunit